MRRAAASRAAGPGPDAVSPGAADAFALAADDPRRSAVKLTNPLSEQEPLLRTSLLPPLLATLKRNLGRGRRDLALYEIGTVFQPRLAAKRCCTSGGSGLETTTAARSARW